MAKMSDVVKNPVTGKKVSMSPIQLLGMAVGFGVLLFLFDVGKSLKNKAQALIPTGTPIIGQAPSSPEGPVIRTYGI